MMQRNIGRHGSVALDADVMTGLCSGCNTLWARLRRQFQCFLMQRALRAAEAELQTLDARTLKNIGLHRSEIGSILRDMGRERKHHAAPGWTCPIQPPRQPRQAATAAP